MTKNEPVKINGSMRTLSDETLAALVAKVRALRDAGKPFKEILPEVKHFWPEDSAPRDANGLAKFISMVADSRRAPAGLKEWYANRKRFAIGLPPVSRKPKPKAEKPKPVATKPPTTTSEPMIPKSTVKVQLRELFASSRQLVKLGAMDADGVFDMALKYIDKL